ncbi:MAG TPA: RHS repeat-associated core domain-containing protein [Gammaproteobacteria bacterium]|nr:RHS repeat-associated core domain-containing protein [Gammaproteobacteria bacterium]
MYTTSLTGSTQYASLAAAEAAMRAAASFPLTHDPSGDSLNGAVYTRHYKTPDRRPAAELPWQTFEACRGGETQIVDCFAPHTQYPTEQAALNVLSSSSCPVTLVDAEWIYPNLNQPAQPFHQGAQRRYKYTNPQGYCSEWYWTHAYVLASRSYECPAGYQKQIDLAGDEQVYCTSSYTASVYELSDYDNTANPECVGNPCSPATGGKIQTFDDYEAPGIRFSRAWRSKVAPRVAYSGTWGAAEPGIAASGSPVAEAALPWGWTHSYAMQLERHSNDFQLFRPDGALVALASVSSGVYAATDGSGLQVRIAPSDATAYLPDGDREVYHRYSCQVGGSFVDRYRLEQTVSASGLVTQVQYQLGGCSKTPPYRIVGPFGHTVEIEYNTTGDHKPFINRLLLRGGQSIQFSYVTKTIGSESADLLKTATYQDGATVQYLYEDDSAGNMRFLTGLVDERGLEYASFAYDGEGRALSTERAGGFFRWTFNYDANGSTTTVDANDVATVYGFQAGIGNGRIIGPVTRGGALREKSNETSAQHRLLFDTDERGIVTKYQYNTFHLTAKTEAFGAVDVAPRTTTYAYLNDTSQLTTLVTGPSACSDGTQRSKSVAMVYLAGTQLVTERNETGWTGESGTCQPISRATTFEYGAVGSFTRINGLPIAIRGPRPGVADDVLLTYYECTTGRGCGQVKTITNAAGHVWNFEVYDDHGRVTEMDLPNANERVFLYGPRGRLEATADVTTSFEVRTTIYDYYANGMLQRVTDPTGAFREYTYNDARLLTEVRDNTDNRVEYGYDLVGNRTSETIRDPQGVVTSTRASSYDDFNHLDTVSLPNPAGGEDTWNYDYDAVGLLQSVTSPEGKVTTYESYDSLGRLVSYLNALNERTTYVYDARDDVTSVTALATPQYPAGVVTTYQYDDFGRHVRETSADRGVLTHAYDEADNLGSTVDARGLTTDYVYDGLNRLTTIRVAPQGGGTQETLSLVYDDLNVGGRRGRIVSASAQNGSLAYTYEYDDFGRRVIEQLSGSTLSTPVRTQFVYDQADRIEEIHRGTPSQPDRWVTRTVRDAAGVVTDVEDRRGTPVDVVGNVEHAPFGPYTAMSFHNGRQVTRTLDQRYRVSTSLTAATVLQQSLVWTPDENLDSQDRGPYAFGWTYGYDAVNHLTGATVGTQLTSYYYDRGLLSGLQVADPPDNMFHESYTYSEGTNRLAQIQDHMTWPQFKAVTADASGNMTATELLSVGYQFDSLGQLRLVHAAGFPTSVKGRYDFNHLGERARKETYPGGVTQVTLFAYLPDGKLLGETVFNDNVLAEQRDYVWMDDTPVAMHVTKLSAGGTIADDKTYYLHADHLDSPKAATTASGTLVWQFLETAFAQGEGYVANSSGGPISPINLRFPGQYFDSEAWLNYNYHRHYWPHLGRYTQPDPIGLDGGLNPYLYAAGNPLRFVDPLGLDPLEVIIWNPVGRGRSSLGHVSVRIGDRSYSLAPGGMDKRPFEEYLAINRNFRGGYGLVLDIPTESLNRIQKTLENFNEPYSYVDNNCTAPIQEALGREYGLGRSGTPWAGQRSFLPPQLDLALRNSFQIVDQTFYPKQ